MHAADFFGKPAEMDSVCSFGSVVRLNYRLQLFFLEFFEPGPQDTLGRGKPHERDTRDTKRTSKVKYGLNCGPKRIYMFNILNWTS